MTQPAGIGRVFLYQHNFAPHPVSGTFTGSTGSGWDTESAYSFIVVAWYTSAETNVYNAGANNFGYDTDLTALAFEDQSAWWDKTPPGATTTMVITWTAPDGETPHHYSVYYQLGTSYDLTAPGIKLNAADIPAGDTSYVISSPTDRSTTYNTPLITEDVAPLGFTVDDYSTPATNGVVWTCIATGSFDAWQASHAYALGDQIYAGSNHWQVTTVDGTGVSDSSAPTWYDPNTIAISGNHLVSCGAGTSLLSLTVASSRLIRNAHGLMTEITFTASAAASDPGDTVALKVGRSTFSQQAATEQAWGAYETYTLAPVIQLATQGRDRNYTTYLGHVSNRSLNHDSVVAGVTLSVPGSACYYYQWVNLSEWMRARSTIWMIIVNDSVLDNRYPNNPQYTGKIVDMSYLGALGMNSVNGFTMAIQVEADEPQIAYLTFTPA